MKRYILTTFCAVFLYSWSLQAQAIQLEKTKLEAVNVSMSIEKLSGKEVVKVIRDPAMKGADQPAYVRIKDSKFLNGSIEVKVLARLLPDASEFARGFIGIAFRINDSNSRFESIYIRPTNGRANDQLRRNHAIQYFSYPDYDFDRLRKETPGIYESYADMGLNEWITLKIIVKDAHAEFFVNDSKHPALIVNDLKNGANDSGAIGLWVDAGTEGFFTDLKIKSDK